MKDIFSAANLKNNGVIDIDEFQILYRILNGQPGTRGMMTASELN